MTLCYNEDLTSVRGCVPRTSHLAGALGIGRPSNVGEWLSLVEHLVRDQGGGGSNPLSPTNYFQPLTDGAKTSKPTHLVLARVL